MSLRAVDGHRVEYEIGHDPKLAPTTAEDGTVGRTGATCVACGTAVALAYIRDQGKTFGLGRALMATVAQGHRSRTYLAPDHASRNSADVPEPADIPSGMLARNARDFKTPNYGMATFASLFTNRQLTALATFSDLVLEVRERIQADAQAAGMHEGARLEASGTGALAYADAVATYLAFPISRMANKLSSICSWDSSPKMESVRGLFARQAIPMAWDYAEANPFARSGGDFAEDVAWVERVIDRLPATVPATATNSDAASRSYSGVLISTDPPYYDNIGYSDLSDFFYVWLRRSLRQVHPELLGTMLVPKAEELVANPYRHGGANGAKQFFETGFEHVFAHARESASDEYPITVYYAFKQSETDEGGESSTGWETILGSMVHAGWSVTATWPVRSELSNRMIASGTNALASSVVLALRPRPSDAAITDRRGFIAAMKRELGPALRELQQGGIAPVDLPQSAIGPGMAVFSRYAKVIESDGSEMTVRSALARINEVLDELLTEQEGDFDPTTRFAIAWYRGNGYESGAFGDAESLARARATVVATLERDGILTARAGKVQLYRPTSFPETYDVLADQHTSAWEALHHAIRIQESRGIPAAGAFLHEASQRSDGAVDLDLVKELAYLLFQVAEKNGWTKDAISFNGVATSWSEIIDAGRTVAPVDTRVMLDLGEDQ